MIKVGNPDFSRQRPTQLYNQQMIIAVGYRVKSHRGVQFRNWTGTTLENYLRKGFIMNDEKLKNLREGTYFDDLLERVKDIHSNKKVFYRQILSLFATSIDYDARSIIAIEFFRKIQKNLLDHFSLNVATELIKDKTIEELAFLGVQSSERKDLFNIEIEVGKYHLTQDEITELNMIVSRYLDKAEIFASKRIPRYMTDWVKELTGILEYQKESLLDSNSNISNRNEI